MNCFAIPNHRLLFRKTEFEFVRPYDLIPKYLPAVAEKAQEGRAFCEARPARLIGKTKKKGFYFMGANTGVFTWFFRDFGIKELYELNDPGFFPFGGKYVHAPAVAQIAMGKPLNKLGHLFDIENVVKLDISKGTIVHIDNFGLMKFVGELAGLNEGDKLKIDINGKTLKAIYAKRMMSRETGEWVIYPGSSFGLPELGKVRENGAKELNTKIGDIITFKKI